MEVSPLIGGPPLIGGHLLMEVLPPIRSPTSKWRSPLLEVFLYHLEQSQYLQSRRVYNSLSIKKHEHNIYLSLCTGSVQEITYEHFFHSHNSYSNLRIQISL